LLVLREEAKISKVIFVVSKMKGGGKEWRRKGREG
jgi:hypothetical protein